MSVDLTTEIPESFSSDRQEQLYLEFKQIGYSYHQTTEDGCILMVWKGPKVEPMLCIYPEGRYE